LARQRNQHIQDGTGASRYAPPLCEPSRRVVAIALLSLCAVVINADFFRRRTYRVAGLSRENPAGEIHDGLVAPS